MNLIFKFFFILLISLFVVTACNNSKDNDALCGSNWSPASELEQEISALTEAAITFSENPTTENCNAYKETYLDYLDAIKEWEECYIYIGQQKEFLQSIEDAENSVNDLQC